MGDGCTERTQAGLSDFGVDVVARMNELGIVLDLSHCGVGTTRDGIALTRQPPAFTHTMCEAIRNGHAPEVDASDIFRVMDVCFAVHEAAESGRTVKIDYLV